VEDEDDLCEGGESVWERCGGRGEVQRLDEDTERKRGKMCEATVKSGEKHFHLPTWYTLYTPSPPSHT
jgi:hypothetical protein